VILVVHERGRIKGTTEVDGRWPYLATFRDRKLAKTEVFLTKEAALEARGAFGAETICFARVTWLPIRRLTAMEGPSQATTRPSSICSPSIAT